MLILGRRRTLDSVDERCKWSEGERASTERNYWKDTTGATKALTRQDTSSLAVSLCIYGHAT